MTSWHGLVSLRKLSYGSVCEGNRDRHLSPFIITACGLARRERLEAHSSGSQPVERRIALRSLRSTNGIADHVWSIEEIVNLVGSYVDLICDECGKALDSGASVFLLTSEQYGQRMTEKPEFGYYSHFSPVRAWCYACGSRRWSGVRDKCPFCSDTFAIGTPVFCLLSGDLPDPIYRALERRAAHFRGSQALFREAQSRFVTLTPNPQDDYPQASRSAAHRTWSGDESMREVGINRERFCDSGLFHHDEAQAVHEAVGLIVMPLEIVKGGSLLVRRGPMNTSKLFGVELLTERGGFLVADLERQRDRFGDDVVRGQQVIGETKALEGIENVNDTFVMCIPLRNEREQESGIEKRHTFG